MRVKTKNFKAQRLLYHIRAKEKKKKNTHKLISEIELNDQQMYIMYST